MEKKNEYFIYHNKVVSFVQAVFRKSAIELFS